MFTQSRAPKAQFHVSSTRRMPRCSFLSAASMNAALTVGLTVGIAAHSALASFTTLPVLSVGGAATAYDILIIKDVVGYYYGNDSLRHLFPTNLLRIRRQQQWLFRGMEQQLRDADRRALERYSATDVENDTALANSEVKVINENGVMVGTALERRADRPLPGNTNGTHNDPVATNETPGISGLAADTRGCFPSMSDGFGGKVSALLPFLSECR